VKGFPRRLVLKQRRKETFIHELLTGAFDFFSKRKMCDDSGAIIPPLSLEYYEAKIQMLSVFSWKPALEMPRYVVIQIFLLLKARSKK